MGWWTEVAKVVACLSARCEGLSTILWIADGICGARDGRGATSATTCFTSGSGNEVTQTFIRTHDLSKMEHVMITGNARSSCKSLRGGKLRMLPKQLTALRVRFGSGAARTRRNDEESSAIASKTISSVRMILRSLYCRRLQIPISQAIALEPSV